MRFNLASLSVTPKTLSVLGVDTTVLILIWIHFRERFHIAAVSPKTLSVLSLVHTSEINTSTSTNARHAHEQNQSSTNQAISARAYAWRLGLYLCISH